ncbi:YitT family protein, partial [Staphylococcus pasteuri]|uniref:YitT family protein n=1 Tax=Staphylococcus pasteuri TaxID=45972 RepID=UPI0036F1D38A
MLNAVFPPSSVALPIPLILLPPPTTPPTTILPTIPHKYLHLTTPYPLLFFHLILLLISLTLISIHPPLLTLISLYIPTNLMQYLIQPLNTNKAITIIST